MKYYAVLDTNVLVSALLKNGSEPWQVAEEALHGDIIPVLNDEILAEYEDVLKRPKFKFDTRAVTVLLTEMKKRAVFAEAGLIEDVIPDPKDVVFYTPTLPLSHAQKCPKPQLTQGFFGYLPSVY